MMFGKKKAGAIAAGLSLVMALSPVAALADETPAAADTTPEIKVVKTVDLNNGSTLKANFKFTASATQLFAGTKDATVATEGEGTWPSITAAETGEQTWTTSDNDNDAVFRNLPTKAQFPHAGVYAWTVTEATDTYTPGEGEQLDYNTGTNTTYTMVAIVSNDSDAVTWGFYAGTPTLEQVKGEKLTEADFENKYSEKTNSGENKPLVVTKKVEGSQGDTTKYFKFTVHFTAPTIVPDDWTVANISVSGAKDKDGNAVTDAKVDASGDITFYAKDADSVTFDNVVVGTTYTVDEDDYSKDGYATTGEVTAAQNKYVDEKGETETVHNKKNGSVVTGVIVNNAPFIVMIGAAAAGVVAYGSAKRKLEK